MGHSNLNPSRKSVCVCVSYEAVVSAFIKAVKLSFFLLVLNHEKES